jgi:hypothetical protein
MEAAQEAIQAFRENPGDSLPDLMHKIHGALRRTRGAAVASAEILPTAGKLNYVGVGNISARILSPQSSQSLISHNGTVGHEIRKVHQFVYTWPENAALVMHSDGLTSRWDLHGYPGLISKPANLIAAVLYRDFTRGRDDVTVLVHKSENRGPS